MAVEAGGQETFKTEWFVHEAAVATTRRHAYHERCPQTMDLFHLEYSRLTCTAVLCYRSGDRTHKHNYVCLIPTHLYVAAANQHNMTTTKWNLKCETVSNLHETPSLPGTSIV